MATKIGRTGTSSTNATKFTWSAWVKRANIGSDGMLYYNYLDGNNRGYLQFLSNDKLYYYDKDGGDEQANLTTTAVYRDPNAFYHICLIGDSTDGTQGDRIQLYVNGVRQTMTGTYPDQNDSLGTKVHTGTNYHVLGTNSDSTSNPFLGIMSHVHYVDGIDYPATTFGSTDATTGEWKINTSPSITTSDYGNNGYFVLKDGNSVTDQSGNSHNFTVTSGTLTKTEDNPSSVFATVNPLVPSNIASLSNGNTTLRQSSASVAIATLGFQGGKYYWEVKNSNQQSYTQLVGILRQARMASSGNTGYDVGTNDGGWGYFMQSNADNGKSYHNGSLSSVYQTTSVNDILQVAVDGTAGKIWWGVNGTWLNSGDPANGTNAIYTNLPTDDVLFPAFSNYNAGQFQINFGNGYFGTTAVSSAGTNASGNGIFEYDVPTGYTALSTKGLNL